MVDRWLVVTALLLGCGGGDTPPPDGGPDCPALGDAAGEGCAAGTSMCAGTAALQCNVVAGCPVWEADDCGADGLVCDDGARVDGVARCVCPQLEQTDFFANPTVDRSERPAAEVLPTGASSPAICTFEKLGDAVIAAAGASAGVVATRAIATGATATPAVFSGEVFPITVASLVTVTTDDDPAVTPGRTLDPARYVIEYSPPVDVPIDHAIELAGTLRGLTVQQIADARVGLVHCATGTAELDTIRLLGFAANTVRADGLVVESACAVTATTVEVTDFATICVLVRGSLVGAGVSARGCAAGVQNLFGSVTLDDSALTANFSGIESTGELALTNVSASGNESVGISAQQGTVTLHSVAMNANGTFFGLHAGVNGVGPGAQITITGASSASGNGSTGIEINANSSVVAGPGLVVENNGIGVGGQGIDVFGALDATEIVVRDNNESGIKVKTIAPVTLRGVTATGNQQDGLRVLQSPGVTVVAASVFSNNGLAGIRMIGELDSQALVRASFDGIEVAQNLAAGIVVAGDPSRNQHTEIAITNSSIHDNAAEGLRFLTAATAAFAGNRVFHNAMQAGCDGTQSAAQIRVTGLVDDAAAMAACSAHADQPACDADAANSCVFAGSCVTSYDFSTASCTSASSIFDYNVADTGAVSVGVLAETGAVAKATTTIWRSANATENVRGSVVTDTPCSVVATCQSP